METMMIRPVIFSAMMSCVLVILGAFLMWPEIEKLFIKKKEGSPAPSSISFDSTIVAPPSVPPASPPSVPPPPASPPESKTKKPETPSKKPDVTPSKKPDVTPPKKPDVTPPKKPDVTPIVSSGVLEFHNQVRARHGAGPLVWSGAVAASAQAWADTCTWGHPGGHPYGENIAKGHVDQVAAAQAWYSEVDAVRGVAQFPDLYFHAGGHFTAMVWKGTTELGCGTAACPGGLYHVCRYNPPGNMQGGFAANVSV